MGLPEIVAPVSLCLPSGALNPQAIGYSRAQQHICNLPLNLRKWGRNKRWEYWGLITTTHILGLTLASLDYAGVMQVYVLDRRNGKSFHENHVSPLAYGVHLEDTQHPQLAAYDGKIQLRFQERPDGTHLHVASPRVKLDTIAVPQGDALGVVVPWSNDLFQYTLKDVARQLIGTLEVDGEQIDIAPDNSWAVLDRGRGRWPRKMMWNWGVGVGRVDGHRIGLQVGGKWTDGTGSTENALIVDGKLHYLEEHLAWSYNVEDPTGLWKVRSNEVEATLKPFHLNVVKTNLGVVRSHIHQAFGVWDGFVLDATGQQQSVKGLVGWAEQADNLW